MTVTESKDIAEILAAAHWIGGPGNAFCRQTFHLAAPAATARLLILADPHSYAWDHWMQGKDTLRNLLLGGSFIKYRIFVNGRRAGAGPFRSIVDGVPVLHSFDLAELLLPGENVIGIISRGERKGFALVLEIKFADGSKKLIASGEDFRILDANNIYSPVCWEHPGIDQFFKGCPGPGEYPEHIDGEKYPFGWQQPGYDDSAWQVAKSFGPASEPFEIAENQNYELAEVFPRLIKKTDKNRFLIDFGREAVAGIELDCRPGGGSVEIRLGEDLLDENHVRFQMRTDNCYQEIWKFPAGGGALAHFGMRAFRYAEVIGYQGELAAKDIRAITLNRSFNWAGSAFDCSSPDLKKVWNFCKNSIAFTNTDVYNDCPSRERIAYEADSYITMLSHFAVESNIQIARRSVEYQINHPTWPCEWRQLTIPLFYEYLMHSGDYGTVAKYYQKLVRDCSFHHLLKDGLATEFPMPLLIDWPTQFQNGFEKGNVCSVPNAFAYYDLVLLSKIAKYLDNDRDCKEFETLAATVKEAFNRRLFEPVQGLYRDNEKSGHCSFHSAVFALCFGLAPEDRVQKLLDFIVGKGMVCSVYVAQFYLEALFMHGRADFAIELMAADNDHSWLGMIREGATVTTEIWHPSQKANISFAHPWGTAPANIIARHLFGLRPDRPGWGKFSFEPQPGGLKHGKITVPTPRGTITATFKQQNGIYEKQLTPPE
jgi:alpha-L-rhamnosidase